MAEQNAAKTAGVDSPPGSEADPGTVGERDTEWYKVQHHVAKILDPAKPQGSAGFIFCLPHPTVFGRLR